MGSHGHRRRWKICVSMTNDYLGDVIGETYSRKHFDKEKKDLVCGLFILECIVKEKYCQY